MPFSGGRSLPLPRRALGAPRGGGGGGLARRARAPRAAPPEKARPPKAAERSRARRSEGSASPAPLAGAPPLKRPGRTLVSRGGRGGPRPSRRRGRGARAPRRQRRLRAAAARRGGRAGGGARRRRRLSARRRAPRGAPGGGGGRRPARRRGWPLPSRRSWRAPRNLTCCLLACESSYVLHEATRKTALRVLFECACFTLRDERQRSHDSFYHREMTTCTRTVTPAKTQNHHTRHT